MRNMSKPGRDKGLSLVELLVVLGIIAIMASIAVPTVNLFYNVNPTDRGARTVFTTMRAAKIYAATHNVECAVVWNMRNVIDSVTGETVRVLDAVMTARQLTRTELLDAGIPIPRTRAGESPIFVPLANKNGTWTSLPSKTCVLNESFEVGDIVVQAIDPTTGEIITAIGPSGELEIVHETITGFISSTGMRRIRVIDNAWPDLVTSTDEFGNETLDNLFGDEMPCYAFRPDGHIAVSSEFTKQRISLSIGLLPDQEESERFMMDTDSGDPVLDETNNPVQRITRVLLYVATGRVKVGG